jgi:hypothetical protein
MARLVGRLVLDLPVPCRVDLMDTPVETEAMGVLTRGRLPLNFWGLEIVFGMVVPAVLLLAPRTAPPVAFPDVHPGAGRYRRHRRQRRAALYNLFAITY